MNKQGKGKPKKPANYVYDWTALKQEWVTGPAETLNAFRIRKGIVNQGVFYAHVNDDGWVAAREKIASKALEKAIEKTSSNIAEEWTTGMNMMRFAERVAARILKKKVTFNEETDEVTINIDTGELHELVQLVERTIKARRLVLGESTENVETKSVHLAVVRMMHEIKNDPANIAARPAIDIPSPAVRRQPRQ